MILFIHMQLVEYFLWKNMDNPEKLELWSKIGAAVIVAQPYFLINHKLKTRAALVYTGIVAWYLASKKKFETKVGTNGHLEWNWFPDGIWPGVWLLAWLAGAFLSGDGVFMAIALVGLIPSIYHYAKANTWGTMWCWISVFMWFPYLVAS